MPHRPLHVFRFSSIYGHTQTWKFKQYSTLRTDADCMYRKSGRKFYFCLSKASIFFCVCARRNVCPNSQLLFVFSFLHCCHLPFTLWQLLTGIVHIATIDVYVVCRCDYMYGYAFDIEYLSIIRSPLSFISHRNRSPLFISVFECCYNCFLNSWEHCSYGAKSVFKHYIKFTAQSECVGWFWIAYTNCAQFLIFMEVEFSLSLSFWRCLCLFRSFYLTLLLL